MEYSETKNLVKQVSRQHCTSTIYM